MPDDEQLALTGVEAAKLDPFKGQAGILIRMVKVDDCEPDPMNPNVEDIETFNELTSGIKADGFLEPILVAPQEDVPGRYWIVGGEHRWRAAKQTGLTEIPAVVKMGWSEEDRRIYLVRMNALRGKLDGPKFVALWNNLREKYGEEMLRKRLGLGGKESEVKRLLRSVASGMPGQMKADLLKRAQKIHTTEDLTATVQSLFAKYGSTVDAHFILFAFGGKTHLQIRADDHTFAQIEALAQQCAEGGYKLDEVLAVRALCPCEECKLDGMPKVNNPLGEETHDE